MRSHLSFTRMFLTESDERSGLRVCNFGLDMDYNCPEEVVDFLVFVNHPAVHIGEVSRGRVVPGAVGVSYM